MNAIYLKTTSKRKDSFSLWNSYPLIQGCDSVAMNIDVEACETDQIFNTMVGRAFLKDMKKRKICCDCNFNGKS